MFEVEIQFKQESADAVNIAQHLQLLLFMLASAKKLNSAMHMRADMNSIDYLITELAPNSDELQAYKSQNVTLL
ncbi:hypothetical protein [Niastella sp. OAS944]|uniref:hypothetical protein n=1 Tax=Niastella sp. OAS944 TaxID=2664089 RepID=UPI00347D52F8|nr:hypothetical protein [Chitinophagaceae bacterium OAS944]